MTNPHAHQDAADKGMREGRITIINRLPSGPAFGVLSDSGQHMFITSRVADMVDAEVGMSFDAEYVVNSIPEKTPWFAVRLMPIAETSMGRAEVEEEIEDIMGACTKDELDALVSLMTKLGARVV